MLCYVMLCYVMLCYVMLCYVMLCYVSPGRPASEGQQSQAQVPPADIQRALHGLLTGAPAASAWLPPMVKLRSSCVQRSVDVAAFYEAIASASGAQSCSNCNG
jgi:hypothetical protein